MCRKKRMARPGNREMYRRLKNTRKALERIDRLVPWFYIGDVSDGPEIGALLDEAMIELWHAKQVLVNDLGRVPQEGEQTELMLTAPLSRSAVCANCGHRTVDHTEGLRCVQCGCTDFAEADDERGLCAHPHEGPCPTYGDDSDDGEEGR